MAASRLKVLSVDDDPDILEIVAASLEEYGSAQVETALSADEAVENAPGFEPDLFLWDVMMPGTSGIELLKILRSDPAWRATPVIFVTARCEQEDVDRYLSLGVRGVIAKPFNPSELENRIHELLDSP